MLVGLPRETKEQEYRVALTPDKVEMLVHDGHTVLVEAGAGEGSGFTDKDYAAAGARLTRGHEEVFGQAELVVKVKEPQPQEYELLREGQVLFTYLHLAATRPVAEAVLRSRAIGIAYETVELPDGHLPLLAPMSQIAGRLASQAAAHYLQRPVGGSGRLMGGVPGVRPARVVVIGAGSVGSNAVRVAAGMGAEVLAIDRNVERLRELEESVSGRVLTVAATTRAISDAVADADVLVGAVLVTGARAPRVVTRAMVEAMRRGSVVVDVAVDQGGCIETTRPTTHTHPIFTVSGVIHYCVDNIPSAVPYTASLALTNVTYPYVALLARLGVAGATKASPALARGVNTYCGMVTHPAVAESLGLPCVPLEEAMAKVH
ncbi:MAG: alanine dehydrogenase [Chloroflexi bacterium]|nr:alanine dehydrogenase [Chloroflexota bacterium]